jgi:O-antigen/teichoic acid export membrane protein
MLISKITEKLSRKSSIVLLDQFVVSGANFVLGIFVAKLLGLDHFGEYSLLILLTMFAALFNTVLVIQPFFSGACSVILKGKYVNFLIQFQFLIAFFTSILIFIALTTYSTVTSKLYFDFYLFISVALYVFFSIIQDSIRRMFFHDNRLITSLKMDIIRYIGGIASLGICSLYVSLSAIDIFIIMLLSSFLSIAYALKKFGPIKKCSINVVIVIGKEHWEYSKWLLGSSLIQFFSGNAFTIAAAILLGPYIVGLTRLAQNLMGVLNVLILAFENFVPSQAKRLLIDNGINAVRSYLIKITLLNLSIVILFILSLYIFNDAIIMFVFNIENKAYSTFIVLFSFAYIFVGMNSVFKIYYRTLMNTKLLFFIDILVAIISSLSALAIIGNYNEYGVAFGSIGATVLTFILLSLGLLLKKEKVFK